MSILNMRPGRTEPRLEPVHYPPPRPIPPGPHQLGSTTLANVETLTNMSAEEIEKLADRVDAAAHETSDGLRAFAHKLRRTGQLANEQLANFVHIASTCAEAGKHMQSAIDKRNDPQPQPEPAPEPTAALEAAEKVTAAVESVLKEGKPQ
jgi:hypothetical protein